MITKKELVQNKADLAINNGLIVKSDKNDNPYLFMKIVENKDWAESGIFYPTSITVFRNKNGFTFSVWYSRKNGARSCAKFLLLLDKGIVLVNNKAGGGKSLTNVLNESFGSFSFENMPVFWNKAIEVAGLSPATS